MDFLRLGFLKKRMEMVSPNFALSQQHLPERQEDPRAVDICQKQSEQPRESLQELVREFNKLGRMPATFSPSRGTCKNHWQLRS